MAVPYTFGTATAAIPLSQLDQNFATAITLGNTAVYLGNTTTSLGNVTLTNVTISSGNVTLTGANVSGTANISTLIVTGNQTSLGNVAITGNISANIVTVAAGAVGTPSITTTGDTNTGIFFPAADTIGFAEGGAEAMRIDSSGNVGIGTTNPSRSKLVIGATTPQISFTDTDGSSNIIDITRVAGPGLSFSSNGSEKMRIDSSGSVRINNTSNATFSAQLNTQFTTAFQCGMYLKVTDTSASQSMMIFGNTNNDAVGSIATNGAATAFNTSSDYRLKQDITPMTGALAKVALLKPVNYKWKFDGSEGEGFIAHELAEVCPNAVTGEKDAVNSEGNPIHQGIDTSFLVATLTAAIQELNAKFEEYKAAHP